MRAGDAGAIGHTAPAAIERLCARSKTPPAQTDAPGKKRSIVVNATERPKPIVLFVHHTLKDNDGDLMDAERLFEIVRPHRQVKAIFYGHSHVWELKRRDDLHLVNLPAVGYNFKDADPVGWVDARFDPRGVQLTLHVLAGKHSDDRRVRRLNWV